MRSRFTCRPALPRSPFPLFPDSFFPRVPNDTRSSTGDLHLLSPLFSSVASVNRRDEVSFHPPPSQLTASDCRPLSSPCARRRARVIGETNGCLFMLLSQPPADVHGVLMEVSCRSPQPRQKHTLFRFLSPPKKPPLVGAKLSVASPVFWRFHFLSVSFSSPADDWWYLFIFPLCLSRVLRTTGFFAHSSSLDF